MNIGARAWRASTIGLAYQLFYPRNRGDEATFGHQYVHGRAGYSIPLVLMTVQAHRPIIDRCRVYRKLQE